MDRRSFFRLPAAAVAAGILPNVAPAPAAALTPDPHLFAATSLDGVTWTRQKPYSGEWATVAWDGTVFRVVGAQ